MNTFHLSALPFEEARRLTLAKARFLGGERVALQNSVGRVLAEDVKSDLDFPPFDKSAMDGYACRKRDLALDLQVVEIIPAGRKPARRIGPGQCAKIMTGAMIPAGADCVFQVERSVQVGDRRVRFTGGGVPANICFQGEDGRAGEVLAPKGAPITSRLVAVLASVGCTQPLVARRPKVGIIATGSELVDPAQRPGPGKIRNSNRPQLVAQTAAAGAVPRGYRTARDTRRSIAALVGKALAENDVVLVSGGVSAGDFDVVPDAIQELGLRIVFRKIAIQPGMPSLFAVAGRTWCFGLPGNPVSTFVIFDLLVKPFLLKLMGHDFRPPVSLIRLAGPVSRHKIERDSWVPVRTIGAAAAQPVPYHGSADFVALAKADGLICIPKGVKGFAKGDWVAVRWI